jgi:hypothetical protein
VEASATARPRTPLLLEDAVARPLRALSQNARRPAERPTGRHLFPRPRLALVAEALWSRHRAVAAQACAALWCLARDPPTRFALAQLACATHAHHHRCHCRSAQRLRPAAAATAAAAVEASAEAAATADGNARGNPPEAEAEASEGWTPGGPPPLLRRKVRLGAPGGQR